MKILVSGSTGQLGQELQAIASKYKQCNFDFRDRRGLDLSSKTAITNTLRNSDYDYFINAGAYTAVDHAETDHKKAFSVNSRALQHIGKSAPTTTKVLHISSDYVYHIDPKRPLKETDKTQPKGIYAQSKREGELNLLKQRPDSLIIRTSWVYSSFGNNFVKTMLRLGKSQDYLSIVSDQLGTPTYARDLAKVLMTMITKMQKQPELKAKCGYYNYSNLGLTDWSGFAKEIFKQAGITCKVGYTTTAAYNAPAPRPLWSMLSKEKIQTDFHIDIAEWQKSLSNCLKELNLR